MRITMKILSKYTMMAMLVMMGLSASVWAQGPLQKRINFSINVPYALRMGDYMLPAGDYVLHQVIQNDTNLFALHPRDLTEEPIAMIRTVRIDFQSGDYPDDTKILLRMDNEGSADSVPVIEGWTIPGMDGWEIIGVVEKKKGTLVRVG